MKKFSKKDKTEKKPLIDLKKINFKKKKTIESDKNDIKEDEINKYKSEFDEIVAIDEEVKKDKPKKKPLINLKKKKKDDSDEINTKDEIVKDNSKKKPLINLKKKKKDENDRKIKEEEITKDKAESDVKVMKVKVKKKKVKKEKIKKEKKTKRKRKWWKKLLSFFLVCGALAVFAVFAFCIYIVYSCDEFDPNALANHDQTLIYDNNGNIIAKLGMEKRESVKYKDLPQVLIDAIIATEDSRYFEHNGVDCARFLKASVGQLLGNSDAGGASTLTMQVVKNNLTSRERSIIRKFKDVYLAVFFMEEKYTKEEILEFYVNDSLLGGNVYGVQEASNYYFGKSVSELSLPEAAIIAGLFQAPNAYNPYLYPEAATSRRNIVLKLMVRHGYITQEEADIANSIDVTSLLANNNYNTSYQGFIDTVSAEIIDKTGFDPALVSMEVHTTMDAGIQDGINKVLAGEGYTWKDDSVQAAVTIVDVNTGAIVAIGTGRNRGRKEWNYATQTLRQPGSTAKPIFAYAPGFEFDNFSTYQLFNDEKWTYTGGGSIGNWDNKYKGLMTLREALSISRNIPALKAFQTVQTNVGNNKIVEFAEGLGIKLKDNVAYESYSIGGLSEGVNTLQMAAAYAAFANGGYYTEPYTVKSITYRDSGEVVDFEAKKTQAMKDSTAYLITNVLEYAARHGFDGGTKGYKGTVAVKTGTSNFDNATLKAKGLPSTAVNDLWSVAYTPQYSIALWYGYDVASKNAYSASSDGTKYKDPLMRAIMNYIPVNNDKFAVPGSVVASKVEFGTWPAMKPSKYTPSDLIKTEYFISGTEPTDESPRFAKLNGVTNLKTTSTASGTKLTWEHKEPEVLNLEYLTNYFKQSVFGKESGKFLDERLDYNQNHLGGLGYGIYQKNSDGSLTAVGFTTDKSYTYSSTKSGSVTLVVKAEYRNFKDNASDGTEVIVMIADKEEPDDDSSGNSSKLQIKLNGKEKVDAVIGKYKEDDVKVLINGIAVTSKAKVIYELNGVKYNTAKDLENAVNAITTPQKITIKYTAEYDESRNTITRTVNLTNE